MDQRFGQPRGILIIGNRHQQVKKSSLHCLALYFPLEIGCALRKGDQFLLKGFGRDKVTQASERVRFFTEVVQSQRSFVCIQDRKSTRLNSSHVEISYAVF